VGQPVSVEPGRWAEVRAPCRRAAEAGLTRWQTGLLVVFGLLSVSLWLGGHLFPVLRVSVGAVILVLSTVRIAACLTPAPEVLIPAPGREDQVWPVYSAILALYREAAIVPQLLAAIEGLDYPRHRLQVIAALEVDDAATIAACRTNGRRLGLQLAFAEGPEPRTKPRALNAALAQALGDLVVVYDAEDRPHPGQLREAAMAFARGGAGLAVLQSPLRVRVPPGASEIARQFALEYAALFEVLLPFLTRLGWPIPLGGTSNHLRRSVLDAVGGWDPWNVTEDADLGFLLASRGYRAGMLRLPTVETPTPAIRPWLTQRSRWLKGHMQTLGVHSRAPAVLGWRGAASLVLCLGCGIAAAALHGPMVALLVLDLIHGGIGGEASGILPYDLLVLGSGWGSAALCMAVGAGRTGSPARWTSLGLAAMFWPLQTLALLRALWQLRVCPHHWDKTEHAPDAIPAATPRPLDGMAESGLSGAGEPVPSPSRPRRHDPAHRAVG